MVPRLKARSDRWCEQACQQGRPDFRCLDRAIALGDNAFANTPLWEALYDHGMYGGFEPPEFPARVVDGRRLCSYKVPGEGDRSVDLFACNDGVHFCECEEKTPEAERTPMTQHAGAFGKTGEVYVVCERFGCQHRGREVYVPFRKHDRELARGRREGGEVDYTRVNPLWRGDSRVPAMNWLGRQTIEQYHQQRFELFGLGSKDRRSMRRFIGDPAHRFWHLLGDLLWNINVIENRERGLRPIELDPDIVCEHMLANGRNVARLKSLGRAGLAARAKKARRTRSRRGRFRSRAPAAPQAA